jgi:hypothetical protein
MAGALIGRECKLYLNTGTFGTPTWTEITRAIDVSRSMPTERGNVSSRVSKWKMEKKSLIGLEITFGYRYRQGVTDTIYDLLIALAMGEASDELAMADGAIATVGNEYLRATFQFEETAHNQPLTDGVGSEFTAFLTSEEDVSGGTGTLREPSYTIVT